MADGSIADDLVVRPSKDRGDAAQLRDILERELASNRWRVGERLPTERELGEHYSVARNTVRRALQTLEESGLIVRHVGRGTFRTGTTGEGTVPSADHLSGAMSLSPADVVECRLVFEPGMADLVVARANQTDLERMDECVRNMDGAGSFEHFEAWDTALHDAIAVASRNEAMISVARFLAQVRAKAEWGQLKSRKMTPERMVRLNSEHHEIVQAFRRRDKVAARDALQAHLRHIRSYMFEE